MRFEERNFVRRLLTVFLAAMVTVSFQLTLTASKEKSLDTARELTGNAGKRAGGYKTMLETSRGLHIAALYTAYGNIKVYFPGDMTAGEKISGVVYPNPLGRTQKEKKKNLDLLDGFSVEIKKIKDEQVPATKKRRSFTIPKDLMAIHLVFKDKKGIQVGKTEVPLYPGPPFSRDADFKLPTIGQAGSFLRISGPFDGDFSATKVRIGDSDAELLAESPRGLVVFTPGNVLGPTKITLKEGGIETSGEFRSVSVTPIVDKWRLHPGETTTLTVTVKGLDSLKDEVPFRLQNKTPGIISMQGGSIRTLIIRARDIKPGGMYILTRTLTGKVMGDFRIKATIYPRLKQCAERLGSNTGMEYRKELTDLQEEEILTMPESHFITFMKKDLYTYKTGREPSVTPGLKECAGELTDFLNTAKPEDQQWLSTIYVENIIKILRKSSPSSIEKFSPLELISPDDGEEIHTLTPIFKWAPMDSTRVSYSLMIWVLPEKLEEMVREGSKPTEEYLAELPLYFKAEGIEGTSFVYPNDTGKSIVPWKMYFWQLLAVSEGHTVKSNVRRLSGSWKSFSEIVMETTVECIKEAGYILNTANDAVDLPRHFKEAASAFRPLELLLMDCPKRDNSHYMTFLKLSFLLNSIGDLWENGNMQDVSIALENSGNLFSNAGGFKRNTKVGAAFLELRRSFHLFSGLARLVVDQDDIIAEMGSLAEFYHSKGIDSIYNMLKNPLISDDPEIEQWIQNGRYVLLPEVDLGTPEILDSTLSTFFNSYMKLPDDFRKWLSINAIGISPKLVERIGLGFVHLGNTLHNLPKGGILCSDTCSPKGKRRVKVNMEVGLTRGNEQSVLIELLVQAPRITPGMDTLIPQAIGKLKDRLLRKKYARIWVQIEYDECIETWCYVLWTELDWHNIHTTDWLLVEPPENIIFRHPAPNVGGPAWYGTGSWDKRVKEKIVERINQLIERNTPE